MMKRFSIFSSLCFWILIVSTTASRAELIDRGNGLIYDTVQDLTWTQNAGLSGYKSSWGAARDWAENLVYGGFDDWRLPATTQFDDPTCSADIRNAGDYNLWFEHHAGCTGGEMEMLTELYDPWNNPIFIGVNRTRYWTATPYRDGVDPCIYYPGYDVPCNINNDDGDRSGFYWQWGFTGFKDNDGPYDEVPFKTTLNQNADRYAWAVRDGDVTGPADADSDGYDQRVDCDDTDASVYPGATEVCDGVDNNCDTIVDEGCADSDGDGIVDFLDFCPLGETGWTSGPGNDQDADGCRDSTEDSDDDADTVDDVNDNCPLISNADQSDVDADGIGDLCDVCPYDAQDLCIDADNDTYAADIDCDDTNASIYPDATEVCDGADNNCDGFIDEGCCPAPGDICPAPGDMDGDGDVDLEDLLLLQRQVLGC